MAARETVLGIAAAWFPDAQARAFREQVDMAREHHMEAIRAAAERWYAPGAAGAVDEPRLSWPAPKAWGGLEEPQSGLETASPVPDGEAAPSTVGRCSAPAASVAVDQPQPGFETASPGPKASVERGSAPAASAEAELRPDAEASPPTAERWVASESAGAADEPRPSGETASPVVERWSVPAAPEVVEQRPSGEAGASATARGFAPAASKVAELRAGGETPSSTAERWPGDPPLSEEAVRRKEM